MLIRLLAFFTIFWIIAKVIRLFVLGGRQVRKETPSKALVQDPICGLYIEPHSAAHSIVTGEKSVYFCSEDCARKFLSQMNSLESEQANRTDQ